MLKEIYRNEGILMQNNRGVPASSGYGNTLRENNSSAVAS